MVDFDALLARKYAIMQQEADTARSEALTRGLLNTANANLTDVRAGLMPAQTAAEIAAQRAQTRQTDTNTNLAPLLADATISQHRAQAGLLGAQTQQTQVNTSLQPSIVDADVMMHRAQAGLTGVQAGAQSLASTQQYGPLPPDVISQYGRVFGSHFGYLNPSPDDARLFRSPSSSPSRRSSITGYARGTSKVPGKGDGKKDSVPAKLAPGEAVLNKAAAEHMGRGLIAALNTAGAQKMGLV